METSQLEATVLKAEALIKKMQQGEDAVFEDLYLCTKKYVYTTILRSGVTEEHQIEDIMQETYLDVIRNIRTVENPRAGLRWITTIAYRRTMDFYRKEKRISLTETGENEEFDFLEEKSGSIEDCIMDKEQVQIIREVLKALPEQSKQLVFGYYYNGVGVSDLADIHEIPVGTVKTRLYQARKQIKDAIEKIEKRDGIRLHSVSGVLFFLLRADIQETIVPQAIDAAVLKAVGTEGQRLLGKSGAASKSVTNVAGKAATEAAVSLTVKKAAMIIGSVVLIGGAGVGLWKRGVLNQIVEPAKQIEEVTKEEKENKGKKQKPEKAEKIPEWEQLYQNFLSKPEKNLKEVEENTNHGEEEACGINWPFREAFSALLSDIDRNGTPELIVLQREAVRARTTVLYTVINGKVEQVYEEHNNVRIFKGNGKFITWNPVSGGESFLEEALITKEGQVQVENTLVDNWAPRFKNDYVTHSEEDGYYYNEQRIGPNEYNERLRKMVEPCEEVSFEGALPIEEILSSKKTLAEVLNFDREKDLQVHETENWLLTEEEQNAVKELPDGRYSAYQIGEKKPWVLIQDGAETSFKVPTFRRAHICGLGFRMDGGLARLKKDGRWEKYYPYQKVNLDLVGNYLLQTVESYLGKSVSLEESYFNGKFNRTIDTLEEYGMIITVKGNKITKIECGYIDELAIKEE